MLEGFTELAGTSLLLAFELFPIATLGLVIFEPLTGFTLLETGLTEVGVATFVWKIFRYWISQYACLKACGLFATKSLQLPIRSFGRLIGHPVVPKTPNVLPAHSPQKVRSMTAWWFLNHLSMSQLPWKFAIGLPKSLPGSGAPARILFGSALCGNIQTRMKEDVHCMAYTPPPLLLKPSPYVLVDLASTTQPE